MPALHLLHRRPRTSLARARVVCISRVVLEGKIPSSLAAIPARTAVVESSRLERYAVPLVFATSIARPCARPRAQWCLTAPQ